MRCDGCGKTVSDEHIRERIARLELATRFRPIHIAVLFLSDVPLSRLSDYFYYLAKDPPERSAESQRLLAELLGAAEIPRELQENEEAALAEFQHRGYFLAYCCECPLEDPQQATMRAEKPGKEEVQEEIHRLGPTIVQRVQFSYRPKKIALIGAATGEAIPFLERAGLKDHLVLDDGCPFDDSVPVSPSPQALLRTRLGGQLRKVLTAAD